MKLEKMDGLVEERKINAEIQRRNIAVERRAYDTLAKENHALRKENEELKAQNLLIRGDNADLLANADAYSFNISNMHTKMLQLLEENEELRKDKERIDFLDDGNYGIDPRNIPGVTMNGRRFHCLAGRGDWSSLRDAIDAARLAKESEASHE